MRERKAGLQRSGRGQIESCHDMNSARMKGCVEERKESCYRINKWLQRLNQKPGRRERLDLIDFPPGTWVL